MMSAEASGIESVAVNGNMEEGPDHADGKIEDPDNHRINSIKKFKEAMSQNGSSENADMPDTCNRTAPVDDRICDNSKEKTVKENGLNTNSVCSDEVNDKHTEVTKSGTSDDLPAVDPMEENDDESKIKEDEMEVDESKSDSNVNESPMETDSNDTKCEVEECHQADKFNHQEIAKTTSEESVQNNKGDESNKENNIAQEATIAKEESSVEMISSTEQKASNEEQNSLKSENVAQDSEPSSNNDTKSSENDKSEDKSEKSGFDVNMTNCNSEIIDESKKKEVKDSSKEEVSIAKESSKEEGPREKDISKEEGPREKDISKEEGPREKDISKVEESQVKKQGDSEEEQRKKDAKSIDTMTDEDGSEFIITINEDDSGSEKEEEVVKDKAISQPRPEVPPPVRAPVKAAIPNILQKPDAKISLSLQSSKSLPQKYILPNASPNQVVSKTHPQSVQGGKVQYYPIHLQTTTGTSQYMQSVMVAGKSVLVPVSSSGIAGTSTKYLIDPKNSIMSKKPVMTASLNAKPKTFISPPVTPVKQGSGQKQETYSVQKGIETIERDAELPLASWEMIDLVKWEIASHKPDNTFWMGLCNVNKKAELSAPSKFLFDLGSDIVKESAYKQITQVQTKKKDAGKLNDVEKENLEKMKKVVKELEDKLSHMAMKQHKCSCGFQTESDNVLNFHKEHPHMQPPLNPQGSMTCAHCKFETNDGTQYSFHMESEHNKVGRVYSKPAFWQCGLCYYEHNSKNKLTNHKWKCMKHFKANQNQAPHHTDINYCLKNIYYKYQIKKPPPPPKPPALPKVPAKIQHNHNTRHIIKPPTTIQPRMAQGPLLANQLQQNNFARPSIRAATQIPGVVYSNQAAALASRQQRNPPRFPQNNQLVRNPMQVVVRPPVTYKGNTTVNQLLMRAKGPNQPQKPPQKPTQPIAKKTQPAKQTAGPTFEVCEICGGYVKDRMSLRIHFFYAHKIDIPQHVFNRDVAPLLCDVCKSRFWTTQGLSKHRLATQHSAATPKQPSVTITGDNTCWICHQRQANLYTHLLQFHRLSTGECMMLKRCMFCGCLSTNRKDLEIHMAAAHGVLIKGANNPPSTPARPPPVKQPAPKTVVVGPKTSVTTTGGKGSGLVRNNFCVFCCKQFADNTQLTLHCLGTHATCSSCGMVVAQNSDLKTHVCRSGSVRNCPMCGVKNLKPNAYTRHISTFHLKKCVVRLKRMSQKQIKEATRKKEQLLPVAGTVVIDLRPPEDRKRSASGDGDGDIYVPIIKRMKPDEETEELAHDKMNDDAEVQVEKKYNDQADEEMKDDAKEQVKVQKESNEQAAEKTTDEAREEVKVQKESNNETPEEMKDDAGEQVKVQKESNEQAAEKTTDEAREEVKVQKESNDETPEKTTDEAGEQVKVQKESNDETPVEMKDEAGEQVKVQKESNEQAAEETTDEASEQVKVQKDHNEQANEQSKDEVNAPVEEIEKVIQTKDDGNGDIVAPQ